MMQTMQLLYLEWSDAIPVLSGNALNVVPRMTTKV